MFRTLRITDTLTVTPLFDIRRKEVARAYVDGLDEQLHRARELLSVTSIVASLRQAIADSVFDGRHPTAAREFVGYLFGRLHGTVVTATGSTCQEVATLAALDSKDAWRGYLAGRHWFFREATPRERRLSDDYLIERFHELARNCTEWHDPDEVWQYSIASYLGEVSGYLFFPVTQEEHAYWEAQDREAQAWMARQQARRETEPLSGYPLLQEA